MALKPEQVATIRSQRMRGNGAPEVREKLAKKYGVSATLIRKIWNGTRYAGNTQQNLAPALKANMWKKGQSGNPKGSNRFTRLLSEAYKTKLAEQFPGENHSWATEIASRMASVLSLMFAYKSERRNRGFDPPIWSRQMVSVSGCGDR